MDCTLATYIKYHPMGFEGQVFTSQIPSDYPTNSVKELKIYYTYNKNIKYKHIKVQ